MNTSTEVERAPAGVTVPQPSTGVSFLGQATAVEQARAVAEVAGAIKVAQEVPRNITRAQLEMRQSCAMRALADRAFFRYPRSGETVTGATIHLARELGRCWGNLQYGIAELYRDDEAGRSEMVAWAWDVETNTRSSNTFIVPHARDTKRDGRKALTELRDIYENNANMGARRVREAIFSVLPVYFTEEAKALCHKALQSDESGKPFPQLVADMVQEYHRVGVTSAQIELKLGRKVDQLTPPDLANLRVIYTSLSRRETTIEEEFPTQKVSMDELTRPPTDPPPPAKDEPADPADNSWPEVKPPGSG